MPGSSSGHVCTRAFKSDSAGPVKHIDGADLSCAEVPLSAVQNYFILPTLTPEHHRWVVQEQPDAGVRSRRVWRSSSSRGVSYECFVKSQLFVYLK